MQHRVLQCRSATHAATATSMLRRAGFLPLGRLASNKLRQIRVLAQSAEQQQFSTTAAAAAGSPATPVSKQWSEESSMYYSNYPLDRAAEARKNEAQVMAWFNSPSARVTPVNGSRILVTTRAPPAALTDPSGNSSSSSNNSSSSSNGTNGSDGAWLAAEQPASLQPVWISPASELSCTVHPAVSPLFLGLDYTSQAPHFAVQVAPADIESLASSYNARWVPARTAGPDLSRPDAALMAVASGLAQWNLDAQYHGATGSQTLPQEGGFSRKCSSSGRVVYPRIDPAIITLVTGGGGWCLLGRKHEWPKGRYSTLAGFLEIGETLEQALAREVLEESGVAVGLDSIRYVASQPWPFPRSLMVGFYAAAAATAAEGTVSSSSCRVGVSPAGGAGGAIESLAHQARMAMMDTAIRPSEVAEALQDLQYLQPPTPQEGEMEDVRWFHRDWLVWALQQGPGVAPAGFMIPGPYSLAYKLITGWLQQTAAPDAAAPGSTNGAGSSSSWLGDQVPQVDLDVGTFKYVLLRLVDTETGRSKLLVRGAAAAAYHNHILQHTKAQVQQIAPHGSLQVEVLGGGRIEHYPEQQVISVYGYSAAFGPAVHEVTVALLRKWYPFYAPEGITCSYEGY